jgi:hypothetical protein
MAGTGIPGRSTTRAATYVELKAQWKTSATWLALSEDEKKLVKNQFHSNDILNLQTKPDAPAYANLRIIATAQSLRNGKPLTAQQQANDYLELFREKPTLGNATIELKSESLKKVSKGGREYFMLEMNLDVPGLKSPVPQVMLFTTQNGYNLVIVVAAMESKDAELLMKVVERINYGSHSR